MQVILDSSFARPGSALYGAGRKESSGTGLVRSVLNPDHYNQGLNKKLLCVRITTYPRAEQVSTKQFLS